ncbi:MAG: hypothetical protein JNJ55_12575 [Betaproteobacteria bacterium]|nr:hypothetical protein [Betaproteobacteria bacterium]
MAAIEPALIEKLGQLTAQRLAEVEDFVEFLAARDGRMLAGGRLGKTLARLDSSKLAPPSEEQIEAEIEAARKERRAQQN